jgi:myo-inositol-1(or 4)-monophosphatase
MQRGYPIRTSLMNVMTKAVLRAGEGLRRDFDEVDKLRVTRKGAADFASDADHRSERTLQRELAKARPQFGFLMEESGEAGVEDAEYRWVIDPLDGTTNFLHSIPYFAISVAVEKRVAGGSEIVAGVVYDPIHDEMFMAEKGEGAFVNHRRIRTSARDQDYYFVTGTSRRVGNYGDEASVLSAYANQQDAVLRRSGAAALDLAYVAAGRYDACWFPLVQKWDMAAGLILVKEAGGILKGMRVGESPYETGGVFAASEAADRLLSSRLPKAA